ncbi:MAG TPA: S8 family serine peptidase, partial [archaeon]|nr:S8 family serine peptidase [archaeon]
FASNASSAADGLGHGTALASIVSSIAPSTQILNGKVLNDSGAGLTSSVLQGIQWALNPDGNLETKDGADVILLSLGSFSSSLDSPLNLAVRDAVASGSLVVAAGGNCGLGCGNCNGFVGVTSPGNSPFALTVGAIDENNEWACFSGGQESPFVKPDLVAPGVSINIGNASFSGTSFSAAFVAGASALMLQANPALTPFQVKKSWRESALDLGQDGADEKYGWGLLNVSKSIELAKSVGGETLEDLLGSPHFGGTNASKQVNVTANGSTVMLNVSIEFTGDDNAIVDLGTADEELIYAFGTGQVWDSTQSGCRAYHSASVANDPNVSPYPSMDYHAEICGKPGAYNVLTNFQDLTYNLRHYEEIVQNMCSSCSFYNTVWNNYRSRCGDPRSYGGCTYSTLV